MKQSLFAFIALVVIAGSSALVGVAHADSESTASAPALTRWYNGNEMLGIKPAVGVNTYNDDAGGRSSRLSYGIATELNLASPIGIDFTRWFVGPQTGFTFSHLGRADGNFVGASGAGADAGANLVVIPVNLKLAVAPVKWLRTGVHGGANVLYRSIASAIRIDETDLNWRLVPNVGADFDFAISKAVALSIRPDWTLSSTQSMYSATAALGIALN